MSACFAKYRLSSKSNKVPFFRRWQKRIPNATSKLMTSTNGAKGSKFQLMSNLATSETLSITPAFLSEKTWVACIWNIQHLPVFIHLQAMASRREWLNMAKWLNMRMAYPLSSFSIKFKPHAWLLVWGLQYSSTAYTYWHNPNRLAV